MFWGGVRSAVKLVIVTVGAALIANGRAYRCDCSKELLDKLREEAAKQKHAFKYPGTCRDKNLPKGTPGAVVRFRMPDEGATTFRDLVKGECCAGIFRTNSSAEPAIVGSSSDPRMASKNNCAIF